MTVATRRASRPAGRGARRPSRAAAQAESSQAVRYVESSALLAALLEHDQAARAQLRAPGRRVTSAITFAEGARALVRARVAGRITPAQERAARRALQTFERRCALIPVTDVALARVGQPFPVEPIRTLDALHLATAELLGAPRRVTIITRDARVAENARALGYVLA
jgi:predicted nucleic acid-binding protein